MPDDVTRLQGLLNGAVDLADAGCVLSLAELDERREGTSLVVCCDGAHGWSTSIASLAPDPTADCLSFQRSYLARIWGRAGLAILAGEDAALLLDLSTGRVRRELRLVPAGRLEVLDCLVEDGAGLAAIVSARRLWVLTSAGEAEWIDTFGHVTGIVSLDARTLVLSEYDLTDPDLPVVNIPYDVDLLFQRQ